MFNESYWNTWSKLEESNYRIVNGKKEYLKKGYSHFDHRFWFPDRKNELREILRNNLVVKKKSSGRNEYWSFSPFLKILVKTPRYRYQENDDHYDLETKIRPICFASHLDSLIFGYYSYALTKAYENYIRLHNFDECILAYRSDLGHSNIQFAKEAFSQIRDRGNCTAIALDIKGYFDHIDHLKLKEKWLKVIGSAKLPEDQFRIYKALTEYSYVNKSSIYKKFRAEPRRKDKEPSILLELIPPKRDFEKFQLLRDERLIVTNDKPDQKNGRLIGIPQGSAMSAMLSNFYLIDYDKMMSEKAKTEGFIYRRYCDDILIICDTEKANDLKDLAINIIKSDYFLTIQDKKVETIDFCLNSRAQFRSFKRDKQNPLLPAKINTSNEKRYYKALQYLGFEFNGSDILIRSSSLSRYFRKMRARIVKTVSMAYGSTAKSDRVFKKQIFERYTHLGKRNFISYAFNASLENYTTSSGILKAGMNSLAIRKQISRHFAILINSIDHKNHQRIIYKKNRGKVIIEKFS